MLLFAANYYTEAGIHERSISSRFLLCIFLRVLRPEVSVYSIYINNQFKATFAHGGGGGKKIC